MKKKKTLTIILVGIAIIGLLVFLTPLKWNVYTYYNNLKNNHFNKGDRMYAANLFNNKDLSTNAILIYKLIKPINTNKALDGEYLIFCQKLIFKDSLTKYRTTFIGNYVDHKVLNIKANNNQMISTNFYEIRPNLKVFLESYFDHQNMPKGYTWADNALYIIAFFATDKESYVFK
jgi:hypothetical protein